MTGDVVIVPARQKHATEVARNMRRADVIEVWELNRLAPLASTSLAVEVSGDLSYAALVDGKAIAVFGATLAILGREAAPWLLGTPAMRKHAPSLMRYTRAFTEHLFDIGNTRLRNMVHAENKPALAYLRRAGFTLSAPMRYHTGASAIEFSMEAPTNV